MPICSWSPTAEVEKVSTHDLAMAIKSCVLTFSTSASAVGHKTNSYLFYFSTYIIFPMTVLIVLVIVDSSSSSSSRSVVEVVVARQ